MLSSLFRVFMLLALFASGANGFAKEVTIRWKALPGAISYEIQVNGEGGTGKASVRTRTPDTEWKGDLSPGSYAYRIRAIDRIKRPGQWTSAHPLFVLPAPPQVKFPENGSEVRHYAANVPTLLKWDAVPGAKGYVVQVRKGTRLVQEISASGPEAKVPGLEAGRFSWQVRAVISPGGRAPASLSGRKFLTHPSPPRKFEIVSATLGSPHPEFPLGTIAPSHDHRVKFTWEPVEGAEAYEFRISRTPLPGAPPPRERRFLVGANWVMLRLEPEVDYRWKVKALAHFGANRSPAAVGPESVADFRIDPKALFTGHSGYVALSSMFAPYLYQVSSGSFGQKTAPINSAAFTLRGSGEYWLGSRFGIGVGAETTYLRLNGLDLERNTFELNGRYRLSLNSDPFGWFVAAHLGLESRDYIELLPIGPGSYGILNYLGMGVGVDLRKQFSRKMSLGIKMNYYLPFLRLGLTAPAGSGNVNTSLTPDLSYRNVSLGAQALYWLNSSWGLALGGYFELRSLSYTVNNAASPEKVTMDGQYFFGSMVYRFGKK